MESYPEPGPLSPRPITAQLVAIALALLAVFIATLLPQLLPPRLLDPQWQLTLCGVMAENGVLPLMALGLLLLASYLDPANLWVLAIRFISSELAGLASVGFLLLIPLQIFAVVTSNSSLELHQQNSAKPPRRASMPLSRPSPPPAAAASSTSSSKTCRRRPCRHRNKLCPCRNCARS